MTLAQGWPLIPVIEWTAEVGRAKVEKGSLVVVLLGMTVA
jgi:hypothetical protein